MRTKSKYFANFFAQNNLILVKWLRALNVHVRSFSVMIWMKRWNKCWALYSLWSPTTVRCSLHGTTLAAFHCMRVNHAEYTGGHYTHEDKRKASIWVVLLFLAKSSALHFVVIPCGMTDCRLRNIHNDAPVVSQDKSIRTRRLSLGFSLPAVASKQVKRLNPKVWYPSYRHHKSHMNVCYIAAWMHLHQVIIVILFLYHLDTYVVGKRQTQKVCYG